MPDDSTTRLAKRWQQGDDQVADLLSERYAQRLCDLAESQIGQRLAKRVNPDAIANSVLRTFLRRLRTGQIKIDSSGATWKLLATITRNKIRRQAEYHSAQRRNVRQEVSFEDGAREAATAQDPSVEDVTALVEEIDRLLELLEPQDTEIFRRQLEGESLTEITSAVGCSRWTVRRTLNRIGKQLQQRLQ